jgi:hypothetical protein
MEQDREQANRELELEQIKKTFAGVAGQPVPQVDPSDIKAVWELGQDIRKRHPEGGVAIGVEVYKAHCKPGADISAITYRAGMIGMLQHAAPAVMDPLMEKKLDAVFLTAAQISMEWIGAGIVHKGWAFDADDFVRRVSEA